MLGQHPWDRQTHPPKLPEGVVWVTNLSSLTGVAADANRPLCSKL